MTQRIGLIAGAGDLPVIVARGMNAAGLEVCAIGFAGQYSPHLPPLCRHFRAVGVARIGGWIRALRGFGVTEAVMVGRVEKGRAHDRLRLLRYLPDLRAISIWYRRLRHDRRNAALLAAVADELERSGITLVDSTMHIRDHMARPGPNGRATPSPAARDDITFGWPILEGIARLDIGQAVAIRERDVLAVEAIEGTDAMIDRAGRLARGRSWTLLKTARPGHDLRADVPTIGVETIERVAAAGGSCIALGTGRVILVDRPAVLAAADRAGIAIVGVGEPETGIPPVPGH